MAWSDGLDEAALGHAKLNGWTPESNPEEVARAAVIKHLETQKIVGAPADQFIRRPLDANDAEGFGRLYDALGAAKDVKDYTFEGVKFKDGSALDDGFADQLRGIAAKLHLSPAQAAALAQDMVAIADGAEQDAGVSRETALTTARDELKANWAGNHDRFKFDAERFGALVGLTPDVLEAVAMAHPKGYAAGMEAFRLAAERTGEAKLVGSGGGADAGDLKPMSREEALAERTRLLGDGAFMKRYMDKSDPGHNDAMQQMMHVQRQFVGAMFGNGR